MMNIKDLHLTRCRIEIVVDVFEKSIVFANLRADVDGQGFESAHLTLQLLLAIVVLKQIANLSLIQVTTPFSHNGHLFTGEHSLKPALNLNVTCQNMPIYR